MANTQKESTSNLGLVVIPSTSTDISYAEISSDMYGTGIGSNFQKIDAAFGDLKDNIIYSIASSNTTENSYTASNDEIKVLKDGMTFTFIPDETNTGSSTLTINALQGAEIQKFVNGQMSLLTGGELVEGTPVILRYYYTGHKFAIVASPSGTVPAATTSSSGIVQLSDNVDTETVSPSSTKAATENAVILAMKAAENAQITADGAAEKNHASVTSEYGAGDDTNYGHVKMYTESGDHTDGTMTQGAVKAAVEGAKPTEGTGISVSGTKVSIKAATETSLGGVMIGDNIKRDSEGKISVDPIPAALPPSGDAGGDLSGVYPNPVIGSGKVTDDKIGNRTVNQLISDTASGTGTLTFLLSWIVKVIRQITGKDNWYDTPSSNLEALKIQVLSGAPTSATFGTVGQLLLDISGHAVYQCTYASSGTYTWVKQDQFAHYEHTHDGYVPTDRTVNGQDLSHDITLTAESVGAQGVIRTSGLLMGDGNGTISAAVEGQDYAAASHAARHKSGGSDPISASDIGAPIISVIASAPPASGVLQDYHAGDIYIDTSANVSGGICYLCIGSSLVDGVYQFSWLEMASVPKILNVSGDTPADAASSAMYTVGQMVYNAADKIMYLCTGVSGSGTSYTFSWEKLAFESSSSKNTGLLPTTTALENSDLFGIFDNSESEERAVAWSTIKDTLESWISSTYATSSSVSSSVSSHNSSSSAHSSLFSARLSRNGGSMSSNPAVGTSGVRNIYGGTSDMTAGSSSLTTGSIYVVYE